MAKIGFGRTRDELLDKVQTILMEDGRKKPFKDDKPGKDWYYAFLKRHPVISERAPQQLAKERAVTMQNGWNNRISDGCVYAQIRRGLGMHLVTYSNHDTVLFLLIVPIKGRFV